MGASLKLAPLTLPNLSDNTSQQRPSSGSFPGFEPLTANYLYCPNQFFDVCLPNCSRGAVRIVAYIVRQTLGWLNADGNPRQQDILVTYQDLIRKAGVSRGAIGPALKEAVSAGFLTCSQQGIAKADGQTGQSAAYALNWKSVDGYTTRMERFGGFFAGEGNRTPIPNSFFDELVARESLAVLKVVGTVLRHTIGYQNQFGRRQVAPLSHRYISQYAQLSQGRVLAQAIRLAIQSGYIECVEEGVFAMNPEMRRAAQYRVRWHVKAETEGLRSKRPPVESGDSDQFKNTIKNGSEKPIANQFKKAIKEKTEPKDTLKQQPVVVLKEEIQSLVNAGLDRKTAVRLTTKYGGDIVREQLLWLDARNPNENRIGMLRKAIEENWSKPTSLQGKEIRQQARLRQREHSAKHRQQDAAIVRRKQVRSRNRDRLLREWGSATILERQQWIHAAAKRETSTRLADIIRRETTEVAQPKLQVLEIIANERNLPSVTTTS